MWNYTDKVMDHFMNPRNVGEVENPDGIGEVGNAACGDALKLTFKLDENGRIADVKFKTFGCASAIASSSALTELIKGMTIEEAAKVSNDDIVAMLGDLPEAKIHCSVMGMEALQAAIANYKGEPNPFEKLGDHEGKLICKCFGVTDLKIIAIAREHKLTRAEELTNYCKAGGACGACLDQIQEILDGITREKQEKPAEEKPDFDSLTPVKKVILIQEIIDKEIRPALMKDGGDIELIDLDGTTVKARLRGVCASCPNAKLTLKKLVQSKLNEFVSPALTVEEVK